MKKISLFRLRFLLVAAIAFSVLYSCKKSDNGGGPSNTNTSGYSVSFKANGVQIKYTSETFATVAYTATNKLYTAILEGYHDYNTAGEDHIAILLYDSNPITTSTYQDPQKAVGANGNKVPQVLINYYKDASNNYISMGLFVDENGVPAAGTEAAVADAKVTITKLTSSSVEGTFSGTVFLSSDPSFQKKVVITDGKFTLKRLQ